MAKTRKTNEETKVEPASQKGTKRQLAQTLEEAVMKVRTSKEEDRKAEKKEEEDAGIVAQASESSLDKIVNELGAAKVKVMNALDSVGQVTAEQFKKLTEMRKAIEIETGYLNELYQIKVSADTLSALLMAQKEKTSSFDAEMQTKRVEFDEEMRVKRLQWKQEQDAYEKLRKEKEELARKESSRAEEEYNYNLKLQRKKDEDTYAEKKNLLEKGLQQKREDAEKELAAREAATLSKETEIADLKKKVEDFPKQLEQAINATEKSVTEKLDMIYAHQKEVLEKQIEGERNLNKQTVQSLENKIKEQSELIRQLTQKADEAAQQVQKIAIKAIEGASAQRVHVFEKPSDQSKG